MNATPYPLWCCVFFKADTSLNLRAQTRSWRRLYTLSLCALLTNTCTRWPYFGRNFEFIVRQQVHISVVHLTACECPVIFETIKAKTIQKYSATNKARFSCILRCNPPSLMCLRIRSHPWPFSAKEMLHLYTVNEVWLFELHNVHSWCKAHALCMTVYKIN